MMRLDPYGDCPVCDAPWLEGYDPVGDPISRLTSLDDGVPFSEMDEDGYVTCPDCGAIFDPETGEEIEADELEEEE
jgi:hypothetical protein